jgi:hypothetical protein
MSEIGYKAKSGPRRWYDRSTPESRPSSGKFRFLGVEVRSTPDSRRRWAGSAKTGFDPKQTFRSIWAQSYLALLSARFISLQHMQNPAMHYWTEQDCFSC